MGGVGSIGPLSVLKGVGYLTILGQARQAEQDHGLQVRQRWQKAVECALLCPMSIRRI
jgi:hypothetical protein